MKSHKPAIAISFLIVALGVSGILLLTVTRLDRFNFVAGLSLIVSSLLAVLRQSGKLTVNVEAPVLFIALGILLLLAQLIPLPASAARAEKPPGRDEPPKP